MFATQNELPIGLLTTIQHLHFVNHLGCMWEEDEWLLRSMPTVDHYSKMRVQLLEVHLVKRSIASKPLPRAFNSAQIRYCI